MTHRTAVRTRTSIVTAVAPRVAMARLLVVTALLAVPSQAHAQPSTSRVQPSGRRPAIEIVAGRELVTRDPYLGDTCNGCRKAAVGVSGSARWALTPEVGALADIWWIQRPGSSYGQRRIRDRLLAVGAAVDLRWPVYRKVSIGPSAGAAFVPSATTTRPFAKASGSGVLWTAGLAIRVGRFVLQQHVLVLNGAEAVIQDNREYYPLTVGWTF